MPYIRLFLPQLRLLSASVLFMCMSGLLAQTAAELTLADQFFNDGQLEDALEIYEKAWGKEPSEQLTTKITTCYERLTRYDDAVKFLDKSIRKMPEVVTLPLMKALILEKTGKIAEADAIFAGVAKTYRHEGDYLRAGGFLYQAGKLELARDIYLQGRKKLGNRYAFANELANTLAQMGEYGPATEEFLTAYYGDEGDEAARQNASLDILNLVNESSQAEIEQVLVKAVETNLDNVGVRQILYDFYINTGNFMEAFIQIKALDRAQGRANSLGFRNDGELVYQFALSMRSNKNYEMSNKALDYIIEKRKESPYYLMSFQEKAINGELQAFERLPVNLDAVKLAVAAYTDLIDKFGMTSDRFEAVFRRANLQVFYLNELEMPLKDLQTISNQAINREDWAKAKLLMGDIFLIKQQYFDAKATYTEVSEAFRDRQTGAFAKYKLAQLMYYNGEFALSQAMLAAIKDNTSNDISNDAIKLNLLIMDNSGMDSLPTALERFAAAQLLIYQRQYDKAMPLLDSIANAFPAHPLSDEILWEKANIFLKKGNINVGLEYLDRILQNFPTDILGDDALYTKAKIYDQTLANPEMALKYYMDFLTTYPGSLYAVEVRKRIRDLRKS